MPEQIPEASPSSPRNEFSVSSRTLTAASLVIGLAITLWQCIGAPMTGLRDEIRTLNVRTAPMEGLVVKVAEHDQEFAVYRTLKAQRDQQLETLSRREDKHDEEIAVLKTGVVSGNAKLDELLIRSRKAQ